MSYNYFANCEASNSTNKLFEIFDVEDYLNKVNEYQSLDSNMKGMYKGCNQYINSKYGLQLSNLNNNYRKMYEESKRRINAENRSELLPIDYIMQDGTVIDLLKSFEDNKYIKEVYKNKKIMVRDGLNTSDAERVLECIRQGRGLLQAGQRAETLVKPLIDFYAASVYSYAIIIINSPLHKSIDTLKGSHGHTYNHENGTVDFGGDIPRGTFIDLLYSIPVYKVVMDNICIKYSLMESLNKIQNSTISLSLNALLSMIPELNSYYMQIDDSHQNVHRLNIDISVNNSKSVYNFYVGDGISKPDRQTLVDVFKTENIKEVQGSFTVTVDASEINEIMPTIYRDIKGKLWYIESPLKDICIPEICLHFLIISALCNIMRYSPHEWSDILSNKVSPQLSLLINRYIRLYEQKLPMLLVEYLSDYYPVMVR